MKIVAIIPARMASTRLPNKPLVDICGKSMINRVYDQVMASHNISEVIVATDDNRVFNHVVDFGGKAAMTSSTHVSGTDRVAEVAQAIEADIIINIQGDEPLIDPEHLDLLLSTMIETDSDISTLVCPIQSAENLFDYNTVKVVFDNNGKALYFSRSPIPAFRDKPFKSWMDEGTYFQHIGVYAFKRSILMLLSSLHSTSLEKTESLEQLRWLQNGYTLQTVTVADKSIGVDTLDDLARVRELIGN